MKHLPSRDRLSHGSLLSLVTLLLVALAAALPGGAVRSVQAQSSVPVTYDSANKIIYVGADYDPADPAQAPYIGNPSSPNAPKSPITIPEVAAALNNDPALLQNQGSGAWLLKVNMVISQTARLEATSNTINWLRLDSSPAGRSFPAFTSITANGGHLLVQNIKVTSWSGSDVDTNYFDGRSYLLALSGGRMDIIHSEVAYLGWSSGEPSGLAWRLRAGHGGDDPVTPDNIKSGATGSIMNSNIHDNYFGQYSFQAYGLVAKYNEFHHNAFYGFDPHDNSTGFEVAYNVIHDNGKHGIIFSRGCTLNWIHNNVVYANVEHGIMLDRGSDVNQISDNEVYNNGDGVAIFQSEKNLVQNNYLHDNERGVRVNATFDPADRFDGTSTENTILNNTIQNNLQYGIYLYERADKNTIQGNTVSGNVGAGIYIKTGGNKITGNTINGNGDGISIVGTDPYTPGTLPASYDPGHKNTIQGNLIENNDDNGIQLQTGVDNQIGLNEIGPPNAAQANLIRTNGSHGISFDAASTKNVVFGNSIQGNGSDGVTVKGPADGTTVVDSRNKITRNSITANANGGINVDPNANRQIQPPTVTSAPGASVVTGTNPNSGNVTIEIYRDPNGQGKVYKGSTSAAGNGTWSFTLPGGDNPQDGAITALAIDQYGNTSAFYGTVAGVGQAVYEVGAGRNGELTVFVSGPGAQVTLPQIRDALEVISPTTELLEDQGNGTWQTNASLFFNHGVTVTLSTPTVKWLKLRSQPADIQLNSAGGGNYNYKSFTTLRTYGGAIEIQGSGADRVKITSWDPTSNYYDTDISNGRSYILAKYDAHLDITNADVSYLGSADGESYGVSWRDINDSAAPDVLRTRVTGNVLNSTFSYNYYGIYTFQASYMVFRGNKFHNNIGYGFDPHDYSNHFTVEDNESYSNGNHGFIVSRGCNNFVFRRNKSYNNHYTITAEPRNAHGFIFDPGSPNSRFPQVPSHDNLLEYNQAWGNDGYGLRVLGSTNNTVQFNSFSGGLQGITLEQGSTGNILKSNTINGSLIYGIYLSGGSDNTTIVGNTITHSGKHGIYVKTGGNTISQNIVTDNGTLVNGVTSGSGIATLQETTLAAAAADFELPGSTTSLAATNPELLAGPSIMSQVANNVITHNTVARNVDEGVELKSATGSTVTYNTISSNGSNGVYMASGASDNQVDYNTISGNRGHGIRTNGLDVVNNTWSKNTIYDNISGGIINTSGANNGIQAPTITRQNGMVTITTMPGAWVEIYSDAGGQGRTFVAREQANSSGAITPRHDTWKGRVVNATATDSSGNTSGFTFDIGGMRVYMPVVIR